MAKIEAIALTTELDGGAALREVAALAVDAMHTADVPAIARWSVPATARRRKVPPGNLPDELARPGVDTATMELADGSLASLFHPFGKTEWCLKLDLLVPKDSAEMVPQVLANQRSLARALLNDAPVARLNVAMQSAGALCLPQVPIALTRTYLISCTKTDVLESYEEPKDFWNSGWDATEWSGERVLLERAMQTTDTVEYLRRVIPHQWNLARAAKPSRCVYGLPAVLPEEESVYASGSAALHEVGYDEANAVAELSCALKPPAHVKGLEIFNIYGLLQKRALPDGRPIRGLRVVFLHEAMARAERRPLLDVGAEVHYYDQDGLLRELKE